MDWKRYYLNFTLQNYGSKVEDGKVVCPFHGSSFDLATGENADWCNGVAGLNTPKWTHSLIALGKKPAPLELLDVVEAEGNIILE